MELALIISAFVCGVMFSEKVKKAVANVLKLVDDLVK